MKYYRLRHVAQVNPSTPAFSCLADSDELTFLPMEAVWPGKWRQLGLVRKKSEVASGYTRFQDGDVLVPKITPTFEASRSILVSGLCNGVGTGTTELHVVRCGERVDPRYVLYVMHAHHFLELGKSEMHGVAGQQRVPDEFIRDFVIWVPDLTEQRRIADFLDRETALTDRLCEAIGRQAVLLEERELSLLDSEIDEMTDRFGVVPFRRFIRSIEQGNSPQCDSVPAGEGEWGVLKVSSVRPGSFFPGENKKLPEGMDPISHYEVKEGDLLVVRANASLLVGAAAVVPRVRRGLLLCDKIFRIRVSEWLSSSYLVHVASGSRVRGLCSVVSHGISQSMVNLKAEDVKGWPIPAAPLGEQKKFAQRMDRVREEFSRLRRSINRQIELLKERRRSLITAAVTGQIDVTTARGADLS